MNHTATTVLIRTTSTVRTTYVFGTVVVVRASIVASVVLGTVVVACVSIVASIVLGTIVKSLLFQQLLV
jgi:hypothetical protein